MAGEVDVDVLIVGAGIGGLYAVHRMRRLGVTVQAIEAAPDVGGVWYHNSYPGARVDLESETFCYLFDDDLYREWAWSERYAAQPEIHAYLRHVADRFDLRRSIRFDTTVVSVHWSDEEQVHYVVTDDGTTTVARFVVLAAGQLSAPRRPPFPGFDEFEGTWVQTSSWPKDGYLPTGQRVAVIGTGSSGVQVATALAPIVDELIVLQRTPNYSVPARNGPRSRVRHEQVAARIEGLRDAAYGSAMGFLMPPDNGASTEHDAWLNEQLLFERWAFGGQSMLRVFSDQAVSREANAVVGDFVRDRTAERLAGRTDLAPLIPDAYPIGTRRLCVDTGYYETFLRDNVELVDISANPIVRCTAHGLEFADGTEREIDVLVTALGFEAFTGSLFRMDIRGEDDRSLQDAWAKGPETLYGLMTPGFPNLFFPTGPGGPSVLANMFVANEQAMDFVAEVISATLARGAAQAVATADASREWSQHVQDVARGLIRYEVDNYFVHKNADGSRVYLPYTGGFSDYVARCRSEAAAGFPGFAFA